ncbi:unnamed protein product, partial [Polarella glacialis]
AAPRVRLWRDDAGWCPFCEMVQMVLEEMHVPYEVRTVPLKGYAKSENDEKRRAAFREICPDCLVPAIQLALPPTTTGTTVTRTTPTTTTTTTTTTTPTTTTPTTATTATTATAETQFGPVLDCGRQPGAGSGYDVCRCLAQLFPDKVLLPRTPVRRARAEALASLVVQLECTFLPLLRKSRAGGVDADVEVAFVAVMDDLNDALRGSDPAASSDGSQLEGGARAVGFLWGGRWTDDGDGDDEHFGGDVEAGAFLFGRKPCAVDLMLLPLLERVAALLPHPLAGGLPHLAMERWPAVQGMLEAASVPGCCAFADFGCDTENLVGIWLRQVGAPK